MPTLLEFLRKINIRGGIALGEPLSRHTSFRIGGPAEALVAPEGPADLLCLVASARAEGIPLTLLGGGANLLVSDAGIRGIVVDLRGLAGLEARGEGDRILLRAGAGLPMARLCEAALGLGLGGLETFYGMPGSVGGSVFMNARCYEVEISDRLASVEFLDPEGRIRQLPVEASQWSYKRSPFQPGALHAGALVLGATFALRRAPRGELGAAMFAKLHDREEKGHFRLPSAGSMFKNDRSLGRPTGKILDELGFRGRRIGDAMVSPWHANIFVNAGRASARDMLALVELARSEARLSLGIELEPEVLFVGEAG